MLRRPRRNRKSAVIRALTEENTLSVNDLIFPLFLTAGDNKRVEIGSMPGIYRYSLDQMLEEIHTCMELGIKSFDVFPHLADNLKDSYAKESYNPEGLYLKAIRKIKEQLPEACIMTWLRHGPEQIFSAPPT
jgi:porphobilinogen synthase